MSIQQVYSKGIYHGLPTFSDAGQYSAIVTGANGLSGYYMLKVLAQSPDRWKKIYCLSRRPPLVQDRLPSNAKHVAVDFLKEPAEIAKVLSDNNIKADYVFFFSYIQLPPKPGQSLWSNAEELCDVNSRLMDNFLGALKLAGIQPKRFMLQTGAKYYGVHLGLVKQPMEESDPRVTIEPNFYYPQEDSLFKYSQEEGTGWNVSMPGPILGAVPDSQINGLFPLAVYASICRKLNLPFEFPGDVSSWQANFDMSSSMMNGYFAEWMVLTPGAENQRFNTFDSCPFTWERCWPRIAGWYGIRWKGPDPDAEYIEIPSKHNPRGYGKNGVVRIRFSMTDWARKKEVAKAWEELAEEYGLVDKEFKDVENVFAFLNALMCLAGPFTFSVDKRRKLGWHGYVDSIESFLEVFEDFAKLRMIPSVPKLKVQFNGGEPGEN